MNTAVPRTGSSSQHIRLIGWSLVSALMVCGGCVRTLSVGEVDAGTCDGVCVTSQPVNCAEAEQGIEFAPFFVANFEPIKMQGQDDHVVAQYLYTYTDDTAKVSYPDHGSDMASGYEPPTSAQSRCGATDPDNHVFHIAGGPFLGWGGGMGIAMQHVAQETGEGKGVCTGAVLPDYCPPATAEPEVIASSLDVSQWDGVALWARRGPTSQPLLRVLVSDKHTDDDISFLMYQRDPTRPRYCERVRECACTNHRSCDAQKQGPLYPSDGFYCAGFDPNSTMMTTVDSQATSTCNVTRCDEANPAFPNVTDMAFHGRPCTPFAFKSGVQSSYCFDPAKDPPPADNDQQCGDHFTFPLHLTTEWKLYLVPFTSMAQQGFAKKAPFLDLHSLSLVRLTWDMGNIDYYVDNIRFYRSPRKP